MYKYRKKSDLMSFIRQEEKDSKKMIGKRNVEKLKNNPLLLFAEGNPIAKNCVFLCEII